MKREVLFEIIAHTIFWTITIPFFINNSFLRFQSNQISEIISLFLIFLIVYINFFVLIHKLFSNRLFYYYFTSLFLLISIITIIEFLLIREDIMFITKYAINEVKISALGWNFFGIFFRDTLFIGFFTMFRIYQDAVKSYKLLQKNNELEKQYFYSQLETIKSKVNTHFFFNSLDSIYSLIVIKSSKAPETVLNLSDLMRYVVGESDKKWVPIEKEINFLKNYIDLEKIKDSTVNLSFETFGINIKYEVPPMIFESFVNNIFKYTDFRNGGYASIKIQCEVDKIIFSCKNTNNCSSDKESKSTKKGLYNTQNRLNIIYKNNYKLDIKNENGFFEVNLILKNKNNFLAFK